LAFSILKQLPKILTIIKYENAWLNKIIDDYSINMVISDNRYGLYTSKVPCIFITHQLQIKTPLRIIEKALQRINYSYINKYNACWVPDFEGENNISGSLAHPHNLPKTALHYIGPLSRFGILKTDNILYNYCISLSGPEPQRTVLETKIVAQIAQQQISGKIIIVRGLPNATDKIVVPENVTVYNHLIGNELGNVFAKSNYIICRSGYTTVMELLSLVKKAILIPTPGQTEQEYLAKKLQQQGWCYSVAQSEFNFTKAIDAAENFNYQLPKVLPSELENFIADFIQKTLG
jgi:uncharacterized protein (TIGR00661 family)